MNLHAIKRRYITLIEIMIVMTLIILIIGVIGYNYRGALDQGKVFKTKTGIERLETILNLAVSENPALMEDIETHWPDIVRSSPLVQNPNSLITDGWGYPYEVTVENGAIVIRSTKYDEYIRANPGAGK